VVKGTDDLSKEIMKTAQQLFDRDGVEAVSMHKIAKTLGIGQGTLYRRYPNKSTLCFCLMERKFVQFKDEVTQYLAEQGERLSEKERLTSVMSKFVVRVHHDLQWVRALMHTEKLEDACMNLFEMPPFVFIRETVQALLEEALAANRLLPIDPFFASSLVASSLRPELVLYLQDQGYTADEITEHYIATFIWPLFTPGENIA